MRQINLQVVASTKQPSNMIIVSKKLIFLKNKKKMYWFTGEDTKSVLAPYKRPFEHFGPMSRCVVAEVKERFRTDTKGAFCVKYTCSEDKKEITYHFSNISKVTCLRANQILPIPAPLNGTIECPSPERYCNHKYNLFHQFNLLFYL